MKGGHSSFVGNRLYYNVWFLVDTNSSVHGFIYPIAKLAESPRGSQSKGKFKGLLDFQAGLMKV